MGAAPHNWLTRGARTEASSWEQAGPLAGRPSVRSLTYRFQGRPFRLTDFSGKVVTKPLA